MTWVLRERETAAPRRPGPCYDPVSAAVVGIASSIIGTGVSVAGAINQGNSQAAAADYNAQIAQRNATVASQNAQYAQAAGQAQATQSELAGAQKLGGIKAAEAADGLDVDSGSNVGVQSSQAEVNKLDALTIQNQAARQAYDYQVQGANATAQGVLDTQSAASDAAAGGYAAGSSILGSASSVSNKWLAYQQSGVFGSGATVLPNLALVDPTTGLIGGGV